MNEILVNQVESLSLNIIHMPQSHSFLDNKITCKITRIFPVVNHTKLWFHVIRFTVRYYDEKGKWEDK